MSVKTNETKQVYSVLATWNKGKLTLHAARYLLGKQRYSKTPCGLALGDLRPPHGQDVAGFDIVFCYHVSKWWIQPNSSQPWCEKCRSALVAVVD